MTKATSYSLEAVRTDGWFERIGEGIGSFQALCEIVGERFVAFSLITGARITALSVDRRVPENTLVDFTVGADDDGLGDPQRLTLGDFRRRLVATFFADDSHTDLPQGADDVEGLQLFIGVRNLLLAPLYGYSLRSLHLESDGTARIELEQDGVTESSDLDAFRNRLRGHVRDELARVTQSNGGVIDLSRIGDAELASQAGDHARVKQLLGAWPAPLAVFLRTPDGQMLGAEARGMIAKGLSLLADAYANTGEVDQAEDVFRVAIQYAQEGPGGGEVFRRLGNALLIAGRSGEAIAALRRAVNLGADGKSVWPLLARAFINRNRFVAAYTCLGEARSAGVPAAEIADDVEAVSIALGKPLEAFERATS